MYGDWQIGAFTADEYVREATRWARAIRMLDPRAKLVSCGMNGWNEWDRVVIDGMAGIVDYHSLHIYTGSDDYWTNVLQPHQAERAIHYTRALIERAAYRQKIATPPRIAYDEWNVWYRRMTVDLEERYAFADALAVGAYLNIFVRNCDWVQMANLAQMVNAIAPIVTSPETVAVQPIWYPILLHAQAALDEAVDVHVDGPLVEPDLPAGASRWPFRIGDLAPFAVVDAAATVSRADVSANSSGPTGSGLAADVRLVEMLGSEQHVYFSIDATQAGQAAAGAAAGESVEAAILAASAPNGVTRLDPGVEVRPGDRVTFAVDPARLYFFDPDTGQAITG